MFLSLEVNNKLDAVNACFAAIGELPVSSLDEYNVDVQNIINTIDRVSKRIQTNKGAGLWFNRETNWKFKPDSDGLVLLPNNVISATFNRDKERYNHPEETYRLTQRGNKVYDLHNHTYDLREVAGRDDAGYVYIHELIVQLEFDDLPQSVREAVTAVSRYEFSLDFEADFQRADRLQRDAELAVLAVQADNLKQRKMNRQTDNSMLRRFNALAGGFQNPPRGI